MTSSQASSTADLGQVQSVKPPCPLWKKVLAGVLVVAAVALALPATIWLAPADASVLEAIKGLAVILGYSLGLVLAGVALITALLWVISRSQSLMSRGRGAIAYMVHCYPRQLKDRILSH
jgi:hypothetical protein